MSRLGSHGLERASEAPELSLDAYLARCSSSYVTSHASTPNLLHDQMELYRAVAGGDDMAVLLNRYDGEAVRGADNALLTLAIPQTTARKAINRAIGLLNLHGMELQRAQVEAIPDGDADITLLRTVIRPLEGASHGQQLESHGPDRSLERHRPHQLRS